MPENRSLKRSSDSQVAEFLHKVKALTPSAERSRLIFALDATASRQPTWDRACQLQGEMFEETAALGGIDVQLVWYRGFKEFEASPWCRTGNDLQRLMNRVYCAGGLTQITRVFSHAIGEIRKHPVKGIVFIGDCVEESPTELYDIAGQLALYGTPVFVFHEGGDAEAASVFKQIAKLSNGAYCRFDSSSAKQLRDLLRAVAVFVAGGAQALLDFDSRQSGVVKQLTHQIKRGR